MKLARPALSVVIGWTVVLLLIAAFVSVLLNDRWQNAQALPLMFWTLYSGLVLMAIACAIGLPSEKAAFWRTWVLTLCATRIRLGYVLLPEALDSWLRALRDRDEWAYYVLVQMTYASMATLAGTLAILLRKREVASTGVFRFRLAHLLLFMTAVALSCWAIMNDDPDSDSYCNVAVLAANVIAAVLLGAGRGHAIFLVGFLAGSLGCDRLLSKWDVLAEWCQVLGLTGFEDGWRGYAMWYLVVNALMPLYAGLFTGILAAMLYRPSPQSTAQDAQHSKA